jgi:hypothetical protein
VNKYMPGRGFAGMTKEQHALIASRGGKAAHAKGTAHKWTPTQAQAASKKSKEVRAANKAQAEEAGTF